MNYFPKVLALVFLILIIMTISGFSMDKVENEAYTIVENIEVQIGRLGRATPVAVLKPVLINDSTISRVNLYNAEYVKDLELALGDRVRIIKKGDIIPILDKIVEKNKSGISTWKMPPACPVCKTILEKQGRYHFCPNINCPAQICARLVWFSEKMGIKYMGEKTIDILMNKKQIKTPEDIYTLKLDDLKNIKGFGDKKFNVFKSSLESSRQKPFKTVLLALGIPGLGKKTIKILENSGYNSADKIMNADIEKLSELPGIGEEAAKKIMKSFHLGLKQSILALKNQGLNL